MKISTLLRSNSTNNSSSKRSGSSNNRRLLLLFTSTMMRRDNLVFLLVLMAVVLVVCFVSLFLQNHNNNNHDGYYYNYYYFHDNKYGNNRSIMKLLPKTCIGKEKVLEIIQIATVNAVDNKKCLPSSSTSASSSSANNTSLPAATATKKTSTATTTSSRRKATTKKKNAKKKKKQQAKHVYGVTTCDVTIMCNELPQWKQITQLYGPQPVILGYDEYCRHHDDHHPHARSSRSRRPRWLLRVAGLYNSGTHAIAAALHDHQHQTDIVYEYDSNNNNKAKNLKDWDVPWGKHVMPSSKKSADWVVSPRQYNNNIDNTILPVVVVRDPFRWMANMCKSKYRGVDWKQAPHGHCPNLVSIPQDWDTRLLRRRRGQTNHKTTTYPVTVRQKDSANNKQGGAVQGMADVVQTYDSLADLWTEFHQQYVDADFPRLIVRYEDLLFHREAVMEQLITCARPYPPDDNERSSATSTLQEHHSIIPEDHKNHNSPPVTTGTTKYRLGPVKKHGDNKDFVSAIIASGTQKGRYAGMDTEDLRYAQKALKPDLLRQFHYLEVPDV